MSISDRFGEGLGRVLKGFWEGLEEVLGGSGAIWGGSWKVWGGFSEGFERSEGILGAFEGLWAAFCH